MSSPGGETAAAGAAAAAAPANRPLPWAEFYASLPQTLFFAVMFHAFFQLGPPAAQMNKGGGVGAPLQGKAASGVVPGGGQGADMQQQAMHNVNAQRSKSHHAPMWALGDAFDFHAYLSTSEEELFMASRSDVAVGDMPPHPNAIESVGKGGLLWKETGLFFDSREGQERKFERNFTASELPHPFRNESVYMHVYFTRTGSGKMHQFDMGTADVQHGSIPLILHTKRPKAKRTKNLISGDMSEKDKDILARNAALNVTEDREDEIIPLWKPEMSFHLVNEVSVFPRGGLPQQMVNEMDIDDETGRYWPIVHMNDFWLMKAKMPPVNETLEELPLSLSFSVSERLKWLMTVQWKTSLEQQAKTGLQTDKDQDEMKRIFLESNPWLLGVTGVVSLLHTVFDFLAFKNDISFWRKVESMKGLSIRSIFTNIVTQSIIFLYLCDNDASWMILISSGVGLVIEVWKVKKAMNVTVDMSAYPYIKFEHKGSYSSETLKYDQLAMKYLSYVLYPLSLGFSTYSLFFSQYKSWYSWLLSSAVGCVYTFGFIMMTPQLFINYKLKSVAHLPWRAMVYKFLNTIIDDLFAFVIKMPTLHRLSCFRDDFIFLIYLYQRYAYREDRTRVNEYGLVAKDMDEAMGKKDGGKEGVEAVEGSAAGDGTAREGKKHR